MSRAEGDKAFAEAEKKLKGSMFGMGKDPDAAVDCFKRACNNYKVAGCCTIHKACDSRENLLTSKRDSDVVFGLGY